MYLEVFFSRSLGAGEGIRTLDFNLGKVAEYIVCLLFTEYWNNICKKINIFESKGLLGGYVKKYLFIIILNITLFIIIKFGKFF